MVGGQRRIIWPAIAREQLQKAYEYIRRDSLQNALNVKKDILKSTERLRIHSDIHPPDKYKENNDGSFRAYEVHRYRIAYQVTERDVIIVRVRHTSMEPLLY